MRPLIEFRIAASGSYSLWRSMSWQARVANCKRKGPHSAECKIRGLRMPRFFPQGELRRRPCSTGAVVAVVVARYFQLRFPAGDWRTNLIIVLARGVHGSLHRQRGQLRSDLSSSRLAQDLGSHRRYPASQISIPTSKSGGRDRTLPANDLVESTLPAYFPSHAH